MITINFEAATGADLRKEMLDLLGIGGELIATVSGKDMISTIIRDIDPGFSKPVTEETIAAVQETANIGPTTRTRRSKVQIEAEAKALAANTGTEEPPASTENANSEVEAKADEPGENAETPVVTAEDLTKKCVDLGRNGKRDAVLAVFETQFGGATISKKDGKPQLTADQYPAVMEALNAIA